MDVLVIGEVAYEAKRAFRNALANTDHRANDPAPTTVEDPVAAVRPWAALSDVIRNRYVQAVEDTLRGASPEQLHARWMTAQLADGWVWGPAFSADAKTHPNLRAFEDLSDTEQRKDVLFHAIVGALGVQGYIAPLHGEIPGPQAMAPVVPRAGAIPASEASIEILDRRPTGPDTPDTPPVAPEKPVL